MAILPYIYLGYMFLSLYMLSLFIILYLSNRKDLFTYPKANKKYSLTFLVPVYNEQDTVRDTIRHIMELDYPVEEIIVINDNSSDNTPKILAELAAKNSKIRVITNTVNLGKAGGLNKGLRFVKTELVAVVDADSYPARESVSKMVGFFNDEKTGVVTCPVVVRNRGKFIEKLQAIEYKVIAFTRKLLDFVDAIYVTPGPLAIYRKKALDDIGGFDTKNMTEDIEATWHLTARGWDRRMCLSTEVSTTAPNKVKQWFVQRKRWNIGGLQCIKKYKNSVLSGGMLGYFIIPLFVTTTFLGLLGLAIFAYLVIRNSISNILYLHYSVLASTPVLALNDLYITPSVLNYLGIVLFLIGLIFTLAALSILRERLMVKENILNIPFYMIVYLMFYPFIMLGSIWSLMRGKARWR